MARIPTGPRTWRNSDTGARIRVAGAGRVPVNYDDGGTWRDISLAWSGSGTSRNASGAAHKMVLSGEGMTMRWPSPGGLRNVILRPDRLIQFDVSARTWTTIVTAQTPSGVTPFGTTVFLHDIYPGVDRRLEFFNNTIADGLVFHQSARDQLQALGGWAGKWLGSVSDVDLSGVTGAQIRNHLGQTIAVDDTGVMIDEDRAGLGFDLAVGGQRFVALSGFSLLEGPTGATWSLDNPAGWIKVRRFLIVVGGRLKLVELFDPKQTVVIPPGDIAHDPVFGNEGVEAGNLPMADHIRADTYTMGAIAGTMDSISIYLTDRGGTGGNKTKCAIYETDSSFLGETVEQDPGVNGAGWSLITNSGTTNLVADADYRISVWCNFATNCKVAAGGGGDNTLDDNNQVYGSWPDPANFAFNRFTKDLSIFCTYTEESAGPPLGGLALMGVGR